MMGLNCQEIRRVIKVIKADKPEHFEYSRLLSVFYRAPNDRDTYIAQVSVSTIEDEGIPLSEFFEKGVVLRKHACHTAACVAGYVCIIHGDEYEKQRRESPSDKYLTMMEFATEKLGLDADTATALFNQACKIASRDDALARLEWVAKHGNLDEYDWNSESWVVRGVVEAD